MIRVADYKCRCGRGYIVYSARISNARFTCTMSIDWRMSCNLSEATCNYVIICEAYNAQYNILSIDILMRGKMKDEPK